MIQTLAIFIDAYRELSAKKMFWIVMALSLFVVVMFATLGQDEEGFTFLIWTVPFEFASTRIMPPEVFYTMLFNSIGVQIWLTWIAAILALISTASIIPDFVSSGSIELTLSKPMGRLRLFLTKYCAGLAFAVLQVGVFALGSFLVIGIRGGVWLPGVFLAIPIVTLFFSYLFCVCALIGLVSRSTITALLLTLLFWFVIWLVHTSETTILQFKIQAEIDAENSIRSVERSEEQVDRLNGELAELDREDPENASAVRTLEPRLGQEERNIERATETREAAESRGGKLAPWHAGFFAVKTVLPKTVETTELLNRYLISDEDSERLTTSFEDSDLGGPVQVRLAEEIGSRSVGWVIGTSVAFEFFILVLGSWYFCRKDF